jgi:phosphatidate phosphatase APP1
MGWQRRVGRVANYLEGYYDGLMHAYTKYFDRKSSIQIVPYHGFGSNKLIFLKGRVLKDKRITRGSETDTRWQNFKNTLKRFNSSEVPQARLLLTIPGWHGEVVADEEGFFEILIELASPIESNQLWHSAEFRLLDPRPHGAELRQTGQFLVPPLTARFGIISDMDDTVLQTRGGSFLRTAATVLFGNARTRLPFEGVADFYRSLQGQQQNPIFYVSSSPWNFYDLLMDFFDLHQIPIGPLFLRDWGVTENEVLPTDHREHKLSTIQRILKILPDMPFILIGDSSQEDPEIYHEIARLYPRRILAIYIRAVTHNAHRLDKIVSLGETLREIGSPLVLAKDTREAALHAANQGWIQATSS